MGFPNLKQLGQHLREVLPTVHPVRFRRRPGSEMSSDSYGVCSLVISKKTGLHYFSITIDRSLPWKMVELIVIHEYAHALAWTVVHPNHEDHGPEFGLAYAKVYQHAKEIRT